jgi:hypothetical protein
MPRRSIETDPRRHTPQGLILPLGASALTYIRSVLPDGGRSLLLTHRDPRAVALHYRRTAESRLPLVHYDPDQTPSASTGFLPGRFGRVAVTHLREPFITRRRQMDYGRYATAVVYDLEGTMMAGLISREASEAIVAAGRYNLFLGGAEPGLDTASGFYDRQEDRLHVPVYGVEAGQTIALEDFDADEPIF